MIAFKKETKDKLNEMIAEWQKNHKTEYHNFFGLQENCEYEYYESVHTFILRKCEFYFYRIYFLSEDRGDVISQLSDLSGEVYVFNIPTKKPIEEWDGLLKVCGFKYYETYTKYSIDMSKIGLTLVEDYVENARVEETDEIMKLLLEGLPVFTAHLPEKERLKQMISENKVRVTHDDGYVSGVCISYVTGTTASGDAWVSHGSHGLDLLMDMYNGFINNGAKRYLFWVRDSNTKVRKMYIRSGAISLGIKDYTYVKYNNEN